MNGLDLSEGYWRRHGPALLDGVFAPWRGRIAVGLVGDGSDCLGFDDLYSRDHDWGPGFCLWLTAADHAEIGAALHQAYQALAASSDGFRRQEGDWGQGRVGVFETGAFYKSFIGRPGIPATLAEWFRIPEKNLAAVTSGRVFCDPLDDFSRIRRGLLGFYPDDVRLAKIAARCMTAGQSGQYNLPRSIQRGEAFAARYAETKFCADIMSLVYLLNRRYAPYYKWLHRGLAALPRLGAAVSGLVSAMMAAAGAAEKAEAAAALCAAVIADLRAQGLSLSASRFLVDHGPEVHGKIIDQGLRAADIWAAP